MARGAVTLSESVSIRVKVSRSVPADDLISHYAGPLLDLICLGTQRTNAYTQVILRSGRHAIRMAPRRIARRDIYFHAEWITSGVPAVPEDLLQSRDQLFTLGDGGVAFAELIPRWMTLRRDLNECLTPYFALVYAPPTFQDTRLIALAQALEAYHRLRYTQWVIPEEEFNQTRKAMVKAIPQEQRDLLAGRLAFLNEPSQKDRLRQLVLRTSPVLPGLFSNQPQFVNEMVEERNRRTHPAGGNRPRPLAAAALYRVVRTADYIIQACLMQELGFGEAVEDLFNRNREYGAFVAQIPQLR